MITEEQLNESLERGMAILLTERPIFENALAQAMNPKYVLGITVPFIIMQLRNMMAMWIYGFVCGELGHANIIAYFEALGEARAQEAVNDIFASKQDEDWLENLMKGFGDGSSG